MVMSIVLVMLFQLVLLQIACHNTTNCLLTFFIVVISHYVKGPLAEWGYAAPAEALSLHTEDEK